MDGFEVCATAEDVVICLYKTIVSLKLIKELLSMAFLISHIPSTLGMLPESLELWANWNCMEDTSRVLVTSCTVIELELIILRFATFRALVEMSIQADETNAQVDTHVVND